MKALKITVSGSYRTANKDIVDFENVKGVIPLCNEDVAKMHVQSRYVARWIKDVKDKQGKLLYPERIEDIRTVSVDDIEETEFKFSYVGKSIHEMTHEELQDMATAKDLRAIPLYKAEDLRETRIKAYKAYHENVFNKPELKIHDEGFNFSKLNPIIVDGYGRTEQSGKLSNEDIIELEQNNKTRGDLQSSLSRAELLKIANDRNITVNPEISDIDLYKKLFQGA